LRLLALLSVLLLTSGCLPWGARVESPSVGRGGVPVRPLVRAAAAQSALAFTQRLPANPPPAAQRVLAVASRLPSASLDARWPALSSRLSIALAQSMLPPGARAVTADARGVRDDALAHLQDLTPVRLSEVRPTKPGAASAAFSDQGAARAASGGTRPPPPPLAAAPSPAKAQADDTGGLQFTWLMDSHHDHDHDHDDLASDALFDFDIDLDPESASHVARILQQLAAAATPDEGTTWVMRAPVRAPHITSGFGMRRDPLNPKHTRMHHGVDFGGATGEPVFAAGPGKVIFAGVAGTAGKAVVIKHPGGVLTHYFHLSRIDVRQDQVVSAGDTIGGIGATGRATGPHLHFQLTLRGQLVDPLPWIGRALSADEG
jgi:murein DD-endopeptidase MepM/ murein hydrolase activator NlpD